MWYKITDSGIIIEVKVQTKSSSQTVEAATEDYIKIKVNTPPVDGKANEAVIKLLSKKLGISKSSISIIRGLTSRRKSIKISNTSLQTIESLIK